MAKAKRKTTTNQKERDATEVARREIVGGREYKTPWKLSERALDMGIVKLIDADGNTIVENVRGQLAGDRIVAAVNFFTTNGGKPIPLDRMQNTNLRGNITYAMQQMYHTLQELRKTAPKSQHWRIDNALRQANVWFSLVDATPLGGFPVISAPPGEMVSSDRPPRVVAFEAGDKSALLEYGDEAEEEHDEGYTSGYDDDDTDDDTDDPEGGMAAADAIEQQKDKQTRRRYEDELTLDEEELQAALRQERAGPQLSPDAFWAKLTYRSTVHFWEKDGGRYTSLCGKVSGAKPGDTNPGALCPDCAGLAPYHPAGYTPDPRTHPPKLTTAPALVEGWYSPDGKKKCHYYVNAPANGNADRMINLCNGAVWGGTGNTMRPEDTIADAYRCSDCIRQRRQIERPATMPRLSPTEGATTTSVAGNWPGIASPGQHIRSSGIKDHFGTRVVSSLAELRWEIITFHSGNNAVSPYVIIQHLDDETICRKLSNEQLQELIGQIPPPKPKVPIIRVTDPDLFKLAEKSESISDGYLDRGKIRRPFSYQGKLWIYVGGVYGGTDSTFVECVRVVRAGEEYDPGEPNPSFTPNSYTGDIAKYGGNDYELTGQWLIINREDRKALAAAPAQASRNGTSDTNAPQQQTVASETQKTIDIPSLGFWASETNRTTGHYWRKVHGEGFIYYTSICGKTTRDVPGGVAIRTVCGTCKQGADTPPPDKPISARLVPETGHTTSAQPVTLKELQNTSTPPGSWEQRAAATDTSEGDAMQAFDIFNDPRIKHWIMNGFTITAQDDQILAEHPMTGPITGADIPTLDHEIEQILEGYDVDGMLQSFCRSRGWIIAEGTGKVVATHNNYGTLTAATRLAAYGGIITATKLGHVLESVPPKSAAAAAADAELTARLEKHPQQLDQADLLFLSQHGWDKVGAPRQKGMTTYYTFRHGGTGEENELAAFDVPLWAADLRRSDEHKASLPKPSNNSNRIEVKTTDLALLANAKAAYSGGTNSFDVYGRVKKFEYDARLWTTFGDSGLTGGITAYELIPKYQYPGTSRPKRKHESPTPGIEVLCRGNYYVLGQRTLVLKWDDAAGEFKLPEGQWLRQQSETAAHYWLSEYGHKQALCGKKVKKVPTERSLRHTECDACKALADGKPR